VLVSVKSWAQDHAFRSERANELASSLGKLQRLCRLITIPVKIKILEAKQLCNSAIGDSLGLFRRKRRLC
jgi:hypothetical protein